MQLKRIFWSLLAGASISLAGCDEDNKPVAYGPPDTTIDQPADAPDSRDQAQEEISDVVSEDPAQEENTIAPMYGPTP